MKTDLAIGESAAKGQSYTLVTTTCLVLFAALPQLQGEHGSGIIARFGGQPLDAGWILTLIGSGVFAWLAFALRRKIVSATLEICALVLVMVALLVYLVALHESFGTFSGSGLIVALAVAVVIKSGIRAHAQWRRARGVRKALA